MDSYRRVYLDGRKRRTISILHTSAIHGALGRRHLLVENVGLRDDTVLDRYGSPHSDAMRISERIRLSAPDVSEDA